MNDAFLLVAVAATLLVAVTLPEFRAAAIGFGIYFAALVPMALVHELGHAAAAFATGQRVSRFSLGVGDLLASSRIGGIRVELRTGFSGGFVVPDVRRPHRCFRWRSLALFVGGPAANILVGAMLIAWVLRNGVSDAFDGGIDPLLLVALASLTCAVVSVIPPRRPLRSSARWTPGRVHRSEYRLESDDAEKRDNHLFQAAASVCMAEVR